MATSGEIIQNKIAVFKLQWMQTAKDTNGVFVTCTISLAPGAYMPVRPIHPRQEETFGVVKGTLRLECDGTTIELNEKDSFTVPKGKPHQWWNATAAEEMEMVVTMSPAYNWETQMEQVFGIMNKNSKLAFLQIMAFANEYEI